jgi:hypothetical protein
MQLTTKSNRNGFKVKLASAALFTLLGDWLIYQRGEHGGVIGLCGLALLCAMLVARPAVRHDLRALFATSVAVICAMAFAYDPSWLAMALFWTFAGMATLLPGTAVFDDGWRWFQRLYFAMLHSLIKPLADLRRVRRSRHRWRRKGPGLRGMIAMLALPLIGSLVIIALFSLANPVLSAWLDRIEWPSPSNINVMRSMLWLLLAGCCWALLRPRLQRRLLATFDGSGDVTIAGVSPQSVRLSLIAFNLLFALQNTMDVAWLWGIMALPDGVTLAEYAHRGAYPLIATALLAALFVLVVLRPGSRTAAMQSIRWLVVLWIGQNLLLVASSVLRTLDYVEAYSLTSLRIAALLWMGLVACGLVLTCWRMLRNKSSSWLINTNLTALFLLLTSISFVDLNEIAADWNVRHAREIDGTGAELDFCYLQSLGASALPALVHLEQYPAPEHIRLQARLLRENAQARLEYDMAHGGWSVLNQMRLAEAESLQLRSAEGLPLNQGLGCHFVHERVDVQ